jgi:MinD-like ATPase involved in chromosome partitioning or flagellar assembly
VLYTQLADSAFNLPLVAVIGDRPLATAVVAANLAATAARQPRATLLVDTDFAAHSVSAVAHVAPAPGLADVLDQRIEWPETIAAMIAARDRTVDILPSGVAFTGSRALDDGAVAALRHELARLGRRYETVIVNIPASRDGTAPAAAGVDMAIVCACVGRTRLATLAELVERVAAGGTTIRGLVLWEMADPARPAPGAVRSRAVTPTASPATLAT